MAIVINTNPGAYFSANGDLIFVIYEATKANDPITYPDYKYLADVYIDVTQVVRIKKVPQPDNKRGVFNIGDVIRNYVQSIFNPISGLQAQQLGLNEFYINATVKFGEEYGFTTYTNVTEDIERTYYSHYNGRMFGQLTILTSYVDLVTSTRPYLNYVALTDNYSFISYLPTSTSAVPVQIISNGVTTYNTTITPTIIPVLIEGTFNLTEATSPDLIDGNGQLKINGVDVFDITSTGTGTYNMPAGSSYSFESLTTLSTTATNPKIRVTITRGTTVIYDKQVAATPGASMVKTGIVQKDTAYTFTIVTTDTTSTVTLIDIADNTAVNLVAPLQVLNIAPSIINALSPGLITDGYYTVKIGATSIYRFNIICEPRFEIFTLHFLNKFGGFESREFTKVSRKVLAITKTEFGKLPYTIDASGNVNYYNANRVYNEQQSVYASQYTEKITLNTDILSDAEYQWLSELILSPLIYVRQNGYFVPCSIIQSNYTFNKFVNDKITNLTIDINFGDQSNTQYR